MANALFNTAREGFLLGEIDWDSSLIKVALVRGYTFDTTDKFMSDITASGAIVHATSAALGGKAGTNGTADANDITFTAVAANASGHTLIVFQSSLVGGASDTTAANQRVIAHLDTGTLLPITPNGGDIIVAWDNNTNKIFTL